jgi:hypothetical protein
MPPEFLQMLQRMLQTQGQPAPQPQGNGMVDLVTALRNDPQGDFNKHWTQVGPGGGFDMAKDAGFFGAQASPQAKQASQGRSAVDQAVGPLAMVGAQPNPGIQVPGYQSPTPQGVSKLVNPQGGVDFVGQPQYGNPSMLQGQSIPGERTPIPSSMFGITPDTTPDFFMPGQSIYGNDTTVPPNYQPPQTQGGFGVKKKKPFTAGISALVR